MATRKYKPTSAGSRTRSVVSYDNVQESNIPRHLREKRSKNAGRNNSGRITVRHKGGGNKKVYRKIDFKRSKHGVPGVVNSIQYDPYRTAFIALIHYADGDKQYVLLPVKLNVGDTIESGPNAEIKVGNSLPLSKIPDGSTIHNLELSIGRGAQIARSAGTYAVLQAKSKKYATVKLPSGEVRQIHLDCYATLGQVGNTDHRNTRKGKAGASRWQGKRPTVRGAVMNPCDHPHGGGEGRAPVGRSGPMTPQGKPALGVITRNPRKASSRRIVRSRRSA